MKPMVNLVTNSNTPQCIADLVSGLLFDAKLLVQVKELTVHALKALETRIDMINSLPLFSIF